MIIDIEIEENESGELFASTKNLEKVLIVATGDTFADLMDDLKEAWADMKEELGEDYVENPKFNIVSLKIKSEAHEKYIEMLKILGHILNKETNEETKQAIKEAQEDIGTEEEFMKALRKTD